MENPFLKRAAEFLRDPEAFLAIVSPEPARVYLAPHANDALYDRLVQIRGTPGSGKTTLSRLFAYPTLATLLRNKDLSSYEPCSGHWWNAGQLSMISRQSYLVDYRWRLTTGQFGKFPTTKS